MSGILFFIFASCHPLKSLFWCSASHISKYNLQNVIQYCQYLLTKAHMLGNLISSVQDPKEGKQAWYSTPVHLCRTWTNDLYSLCGYYSQVLYPIHNLCKILTSNLYSVYNWYFIYKTVELRMVAETSVPS